MRPVIRRRIAILSMIALAILAASCVGPNHSDQPKAGLPPAPRVAATEPTSPKELAEQLVSAHNLRRSQAGLSPLRLNPLLEASAVEHARDMAERRKMSHKGSDGSSPFDRMSRHGYRFVAAAENVAYGLDDVDSVMVDWMKSPGHRRNILGNFAEIGVGRAIASDGASYWSVTFGTPSSR